VSGLRQLPRDVAVIGVVRQGTIRPVPELFVSMRAADGRGGGGPTGHPSPNERAARKAEAVRIAGHLRGVEGRHVSTITEERGIPNVPENLASLLPVCAVAAPPMGRPVRSKVAPWQAQISSKSPGRAQPPVRLPARGPLSILPARRVKPVAFPRFYMSPNTNRGRVRAPRHPTPSPLRPGRVATRRGAGRDGFVVRSDKRRHPRLVRLAHMVANRALTLVLCPARIRSQRCPGWPVRPAVLRF